MIASVEHGSPSRWRRIVRSTWLHLVAAFVVCGLVLLFVAKPYAVPSSSMAGTLEPGDRVLVDRLAYLLQDPEMHDVIVFDADMAWDGAPTSGADPFRATLRWLGEVTGFGPSGPHTLVKRVIAGAEQVVSCCDAGGRVVVDGVALDEPYVENDFPFVSGEVDCTSTPRSLRCFDEVTVPQGAYLVLGDNRSGSSDSASFCRGDGTVTDCWRWATRDSVVGAARFVFWPVSRWAGI